MRQADLFLTFTLPLEGAGLAYMVGGSVASMVYGEPRLTNDIDIVLDLPRDRIRELAGWFPPDTFYSPPEEVLAIESRRALRGHFNLVHLETGYKADVYLCGADPLSRWGMADRRRIDLPEGRAIWIAPPEYVILLKLQYYREGGSEKHKLDIRGMLEVSGELLDREALGVWIERLGLSGEWDDVSGRGA